MNAQQIDPHRREAAAPPSTPGGGEAAAAAPASPPAGSQDPPARTPGVIELVDRPGEPVKSLDLPRAVDLAIGLHQRGFLDAAGQLYERILALAPNHAAILNYHGVLMHQRGDSEAGVRQIRRAIEIEPEAGGFWNNLGVVLFALKRHAEAAEVYARASALNPEDADLLNNLGLLYRVQERPQEAEAAFRKALALRPEFIGALHNLGNLLVEQRRVREAIEMYCRVATFYPDHPETRRLLALAHVMLGEVGKAEAIYRRWLAEEPDNPLPRHYLAACTGEGVPDRATDAYVEATFDRFAESFDSKLAGLLYRAPQLIADAIERTCGAGAKNLDVLDAGCGTGLCGPLLSPYARQLAGVDLSGEMIERARPRKVYDSLHKAELTAFLSASPAAWDLIVSADTLCYFGDLQGVAAAAFAALRPGGRLFFTVESASEERAPGGHLLLPHGRYAHTRRYVTDSFTAAGLREAELTDVHLRMEAGLPVEGFVASFRKAGS